MYVVINVIAIVLCMTKSITCHWLQYFGGEIWEQTYSVGQSTSGCYNISHI